MSFNSIEFVWFTILVFFLYWYIFNRSLNRRNLFLLATSYIFYAFWDWRFLSLIIFSSCLDYFIGREIYKSKALSVKRRLLGISLLSNLGLLFVFKYFNFFIESLNEVIALFSNQEGYNTLNIILPIGISFYTFQTLSYTIDIYRDKLEPTNNFIVFLSYVSFFPQLVAGPIERASALIPQFSGLKKFDRQKVENGLKLILWGFFVKVVIGDTCAGYVQEIFLEPSNFNSIYLIFGSVLFVIQIYADFSGYSNIAVGTAGLFCFNLKDNFRTPLYSTSWADFWRRWHISLSSWILDYVYAPTAMFLRDYGKNGLLLALMLTFVLNGIWHGASWNFVIFGFLLGTFICTETFFSNFRRKVKQKIGKKLFSIIGWFAVFTSFNISLIVFRCKSVSQSIDYLNGIFSLDISKEGIHISSLHVCLIALFLMWEYIMKDRIHALDISFLSPLLRWGLYYILLILVIIYFGKPIEFIYFQF